MLIGFTALFPIFFAVYSGAGDRSPYRLTASASVSVLLAVTLTPIRYAQHGYIVLGVGGIWAWMLAIAQAAIIFVVFAWGSYVVRRYVIAPPPPFLSAADYRYLARRPKAWRRARVLVLLPAVIAVAIGLPDGAIQRSIFPVMLRTASFVILGSGAIWMILLVHDRARGKSWRFFARVDPIKWSLAQLRVAERERSRLLIDDLLERLALMIERTAPRRRRHSQAVEIYAAALMVRHLMSGRKGDLDEAIRVGRSLLTMRPSRKDSELLFRRVQLASGLYLKYLNTNDRQFLDESIRLQREVRAMISPGHLIWATVTSNLAVGLGERFGESGDVDALRESVVLQREAIASTPTDDYQTVLTRSVGVILSPTTGRARRLAARSEVGSAVVNAHQLPQRLANLGSVLNFLFTIDGDPDLLVEAVDVLRRALRLLPIGHTQRPSVSRQLADALLVTQSHGGDPPVGNLLVEAAALLRQGLASLPADHPDAAIQRYLLGEVSYRHYASTGDDADRVVAIEHWRDACQVTTALPEVRGAAAQRWGDAAAQASDWPEAVEGYAVAVEMVGRRASRSLARADQERALRGPAGVVRNAAACAVAAGNPNLAVELLEQGRGILLSRVLDTRSDLSELRSQHPHLAAEFVRVRDAFDRPSTSAGLDGADSIIRRHALAREWDALLATIRSLDRFETFLLPRAAADLVHAAADAAIVMVNVSEYRCDALVLSDGAVHAVELVDVSEDEVERCVLDYFTSTQITADPEKSLRARAAAEAGIRDLLAWLWDAIAAPVLDRVPGDVPRLWWVPTGALAFLPLHAAGRSDAGDSLASVLDLAPSSYTPTIRMLEHARAQARADVPTEALVVSASAVGGQQALPGAETEVAAVGEHFLAVRELIGTSATRELVLEAMAVAPLVHFACHAYSDVATASAGRLLLHDGPLSVLEIGGMRIRDGVLAFLSACATAQATVDLLDETIHLTSTFQLAGYAHVIGTLWPTDDVTATAVADIFYDHLTQGRPTHAALHEAVRSVRAAAPRTPSAWASYIHVGP